MRVREKMHRHLSDLLRKHFEPLFDEKCKLTFVMRSPHLPDGDMVVTDDDIEKVITALERLKTYPVETTA